jgi:hypothetical protein
MDTDTNVNKNRCGYIYIYISASDDRSERMTEVPSEKFDNLYALQKLEIIKQEG